MPKLSLQSHHKSLLLLLSVKTQETQEFLRGCFTNNLRAIFEWECHVIWSVWFENIEKCRLYALRSLFHCGWSSHILKDILFIYLNKLGTGLGTPELEQGCPILIWRSTLLQSSPPTLIKHNLNSLLGSLGALINYRWMCWSKFGAELFR